MQKDRSAKKAEQPQSKMQRPSSLKCLKTSVNALNIRETTTQKRPFSKELIKQRLSNLIRKEGESRITINKSIEKCHSPFSKAKLHNLLEKNSKNLIESVVVKAQRKVTQSSIIDTFPKESKLPSTTAEQVTVRKKCSLLDSNKENHQNSDIRKRSKLADILGNNNKQKVAKIALSGKQPSSFIEQSVRSFYHPFHS